MESVILKTYLQAPNVPITINLIGAGGTGSQLLTHLARMNTTLNALGGRQLAVTVYDPDIVNDANMGRQMFAPADLYRYKADVLVNRVNNFMGLRWMSVPTKFPKTVFHANIVISCTDTKKSRKQLANLFKLVKPRHLHSETNYLWIDCGNETNSGQFMVASKVYDWPTVVDHPDWTDDEPPEVPSCSIADAIGKQDLMVNTWVANLTATWLWNFLHHKTIDHRGAYFSIPRMMVRKVPIKYSFTQNQLAEQEGTNNVAHNTVQS